MTAWVGSHNLELANLHNTSDTWVRVDEAAVSRKLNEHMATMFDEIVICPEPTMARAIP